MWLIQQLRLQYLSRRISKTAKVFFQLLFLFGVEHCFKLLLCELLKTLWGFYFKVTLMIKPLLNWSRAPNLKNQFKVLLWSKNPLLFLLQILRLFVWYLIGKIESFEFYPKAVSFECKFRISRSAIVHAENWSIGSRIRWRKRLTSLKSQRLNAVYCTCRTRV